MPLLALNAALALLSTLHKLLADLKIRKAKCFDKSAATLRSTENKWAFQTPLFVIFGSK